jgi:hypothetical protein
MRGCLSVITLAVVFLAVAIWFGGPPLASAVVESTLTGTGFASDTLDVEVTADPPLTLAVGRADRIAISATGVRWNEMRLATLSLSLGSVDLVGRTAATADGRLGGVQFAGTGGEPVLADVELSGPADAAKTTISIDSAAVSAMALSAFEADFGIRPTSASLVAPDVVRLKLGGMTVSGQLAVAGDGSIVARASGSTIRLLAPDPSLPFRLTGLAVTPDALVLRGTFDVSSLLR